MKRLLYHLNNNLGWTFFTFFTVDKEQFIASDGNLFKVRG